MRANSKSKRPEAERAAEHYAHDIMGCVWSVRAVRTKWQRQDLFGSDVVGKREDGTHVYLQVTAGGNSAVTTRRRKLEDVPWHPTDTVQLLQLVQTPDPANGRRTLWFFRVHEYRRFDPVVTSNLWVTKDRAVPVPKAWFKAFKQSEDLTPEEGT